MKTATRAAALAAIFGVLALAPAPPARAEAPQYAALDPRGTWPAVQRIPLSPRLSTLAGKRIYIVMSWDKESGLDQAAQDLAAALKAKGAIPTIKDRNTRYSEDDPALWTEMKANADAFLYVAAASSSTTSYAFKWSAHLEKMGLPGAAVMFDQLLSPGLTTNQREGADVRYSPFSYPTTAMAPAAYAAAIDRAVGALTAPLTSKETATGTVVPTPPPAIAATGDLQAVEDAFYDKGFTDGLPIVPPTEEAVRAMLAGTSHSPDEVVAKTFYPEGLSATVRQVAINGVMAGCQPADLPILLATVEAFQGYNMNSMIRSTNSFAFMQVVDGPIVAQAKMNAGVNALGPGNRANACIGRALRLFIINLGDGEPGVNIEAVIGNHAAYGLAFAENAEANPWTPLGVDQGFKPGESTLTLFSGGWEHVGNYNLGTPLDRLPKDISRFELAQGAVVILSPQRAADLKRQGMSKQDVEDFIWKNAARPLSEMRQERFFRQTDAMKAMPDTTRVPVFPEHSIHVVVAGGDASPMMQVWEMSRPQTVSIDKWR